MSDQADPAASDATEQPELDITGSEQPTTESKTYSSELIEFAKAEGYSVGDPTLPKAEEKPEPEEKPEEAPEPDAEPEEPDEEEEEQPEAKKGEVWPESAKARVAEETAKKRRANERAERAEAQIAALQTQLQQVAAPTPTEDDPFKDINDGPALDRLERSYEKAIDLADETLSLPEEEAPAAYDVVVGRNADGTPLKRDFTRRELAEMKKKADKAIRKFIPERRTYLQQRAIADAEALKVYPEFQDPNSEFTKAAAFLAQRVMNGEAAKEPTLLVWIGHAVRGYQESLKRNGATTPQSPAAKKIVQSARQQVAPTPTKTRSFPERGSGSVSLEKAKQRFKETGTADDAEEVVAALLSGAARSKRAEPIAE